MDGGQLEPEKHESTGNQVYNHTLPERAMNLPV